MKFISEALRLLKTDPPISADIHKRIVFDQDRIRVTVERPGEIVERLPVFNPACVTSVAQTAVHEQSGSPVPGKTFSVFELRAMGKLEYEIRPVG